MGKEIDLVILSGHGCGLHALYSFLNQSNTICCASHSTTKNQTQKFVELDTPKKKAVFVDRASYENDGILEIILKNLSTQPVLYVLGRDPVSRLLSVANTHIMRWARDMTGVHEIMMGGLVDGAGSSRELIRRLLRNPSMLTVPVLGHKIVSRFSRVVVGNMDDIKVPQFYKTFNMLSDLLRIETDNSFSLIKEPVNNRFNFYHLYITSLIIHDNGQDFIYKPCPITLVNSNFGESLPVIYVLEYNKSKWAVGNLKDDIAFLLSPRNNIELNLDKAKAIFVNHLNDVEEYIKIINIRERRAQIIYNEMEWNNKRLLDFCNGDPSFRKEFELYLLTEINAFKALSEDSHKYFFNSTEFIKKLIRDRPNENNHVHHNPIFNKLSSLLRSCLH